MRNSWKWNILAGHWTIKMADHNESFQKNLSFFFFFHTAALSRMDLSSILSAKFDCPVARQNISLLATTHDCETDC